MTNEQIKQDFLKFLETGCDYSNEMFKRDQAQIRRGEWLVALRFFCIRLAWWFCVGQFGGCGMKTYEELLAERDALAAQNEALREAYKELSGAINDLDDCESDTEEFEQASANVFAVMQHGYNNALRVTPQQCLAEIKAEAYEAGFCKAKHVYKCELGYCSTDIHEWFDEWEANKCAAKVRQGGE